MASDRLIRDRILGQCCHRNTAKAIVCDGNTIDYGLLDRRSSAVAARLTRHGIGKGDIVGICLPSGGDAVVALLATWKIGAAFAPIDNTGPAAWICKVLKRIGAKAVVSHGGQDIGDANAAIVVIGNDEESWEGKPPPVVPLFPDDLAYVISTSGTTGESQCVAVDHGNLTSYVDAINERVGWNQSANFMLVSPFHVDLGYTVLFPAIAGGGTLHIASGAAAQDPDFLGDLVQRGNIDHIKITPTHLAVLLEDDDAKRILPRKVVVLGGEVLQWQLVDKLRELGPLDLQIYNHYGPAETTIGVCTYHVRTQNIRSSCASVPIGFPLPHVAIELIGPDGKCVPNGEEGEIVVTGCAVARGYLHGARSGSGFVESAKRETRQFRTGDIARRLEDGALLFMHRRDEQVKVRGFRVDLTEVRSAIRSHPDVSDAHVMAAADNSTLICWVVPRSKGFDVNSLYAHFETYLPPTMRPTRVITLDRFPIAPSGKIDRVALRRLHSAA